MSIESRISEAITTVLAQGNIIALRYLLLSERSYSHVEVYILGTDSEGNEYYNSGFRYDKAEYSRHLVVKTCKHLIKKAEGNLNLLRVSLKDLFIAEKEFINS